ncbi:MAG: HzsA-related protein, partial [Planctomycetota bacterium]
GIHIYDTYYQWHPGGGIYVLENPAAPPEEHRIRPVIDPTTAGTLGEGVYTDPELSWDAKRLLFCFKGTKDGNTSIYEIGIDGAGLKLLADPTPCLKPCGSFGSHHDVGPAYLPDGRIIFTSTRLNGLVPCFNSGVDVLHVMNADGSNMHPISVNNVNEFDPAILPDGRILYGRWEYVDKTALTQQTLWTIYPDGSNETAFYANNLVRPEAFLDARPIPGSANLVTASLTRHNSTPRGSVGVVNIYRSKNDPVAITNFDHPQDPTIDTGDSCEPWPLSKDVLLFSGRPKGAKRNVIEIMANSGQRQIVLSDPDICLHSPMLVKPRPIPPVLDRQINPEETTGRFFVQDIYKGLTGVKRGEVKWLRVIEETSRASASTDRGKNPYNQTFLLSAALAFSVKNFLGLVPVEPDGSAYFEVPSGRAVYLQALAEDGRLIQSMRTFVQASPGVTRSCIGCHEHKYSTARNMGNKKILKRRPEKLRPESWGTGFVDYPSMIQPVLDKHCVTCHGGENGMAAGLDLNGGWTEHFSISYENLVNRRRTQLIADLIAGIDCMNGTAHWSAKIFPPKSHGSGAAPLAEIIVSGHHDRIKNLTRKERDLLLAWIDTNGLYHGSWDYTENGCRIGAWGNVKNALIAQMQAAGCMSCHKNNGKFTFESDWINLKDPRLSRILRAPLPKGPEGRGLGFCRDRKVPPEKQRIRMFYTGGYQHGVLPLEAFKPKEFTGPDFSGKPVTTFASTQDKHYQKMLSIIRKGRIEALASPRVDMPGAKILPGLCRTIIPVPAPQEAPPLTATTKDDGIVRLAWPRAADTIGLSFGIYRHTEPNFKPKAEFLVNATSLFQHEDLLAPQGRNYYALVATSDGRTSKPAYTMVTVPKPTPPEPPTQTKAASMPGEVSILWTPDDDMNVRFNVYRCRHGSNKWVKLNDKPILLDSFLDTTAAAGVKYSYRVRSVNRHGIESLPGDAVPAEALPEIKTPIFDLSFKDGLNAIMPDSKISKGVAHGGAKIADAVLDLSAGGHVTYPYSQQFDLNARLSVECMIKFDSLGQMPVVVSCGQWNSKGWFLQSLSGRWRWHLAGNDCDGGKVTQNKWHHIVGTFDGKNATL